MRMSFRIWSAKRGNVRRVHIKREMISDSYHILLVSGVFVSTEIIQVC